MKKLIMVMALMTGMHLGLMAQTAKETHKGHPSVERRAQVQTDKMANALSLTADQKKKAYEVNLERIKQTSENRSATRQEKKEAIANADAKLKAIFSPEQYRKYLEHKTEHRKLAMANRQKDKKQE